MTLKTQIKGFLVGILFATSVIGIGWWGWDTIKEINHQRKINIVIKKMKSDLETKGGNWCDVDHLQIRPEGEKDWITVVPNNKTPECKKREEDMKNQKE